MTPMYVLIHSFINPKAAMYGCMTDKLTRFESTNIFTMIYFLSNPPLMIPLKHQLRPIAEAGIVFAIADQLLD